MTMSIFSSTGPPGTPTSPSLRTEYEPGVCNIGPAEIAWRRRSGHVGLLVTLVVFVVLVWLDAPPLAQLIVALPAAGAASGYLQAWLRFCAGFGSRGVFNFGLVGEMHQVQDASARARDRARAIQIGVASIAIGLTVGVLALLAALLPR